jgi:hypothetical protein
MGRRQKERLARQAAKKGMLPPSSPQLPPQESHTIPECNSVVIVDRDRLPTGNVTVVTAYVTPSKRSWADYKPFGWTETFEAFKALGTLATASAVVGTFLIAWNSEFFKVQVAQQALVNEKRANDAAKEYEEFQRKKTEIEIETRRLLAENASLRERTDGLEREWKIIEQISEGERASHIPGFSIPIRGNITYNYATNGYTFALESQEPSKVEHADFVNAGQVAVNKLLDNLQHFPRLKSVVIRNHRLNAESLALISKCQQLVEVRLVGCNLDSTMLAGLKSLPKLIHLTLSYNPIDSLAHANTQPELEHLSLNDCSVDNDSIERMLFLFPKATHIELHSANIDDTAVAHLRGLRYLYWLNVESTNVREPGLRALVTDNKRRLTIIISENQATADDMIQLNAIASDKVEIIRANFEWKKPPKK